MLSRRMFVGKLAAGAAGAAVAITAGVSSARASSVKSRLDPVAGGLGSGEGSPEAAEQTVREPEVEKVAPAPPWGILSPLAAGSVVSAGWTVADLSGVQYGACVVTLANEHGRSYRVHVCRNDGQPQGLVYTRDLDLVVMNGGQGELPTDEGFAQAVAALAHVLAANESTAQHRSTVAALQPHNERQQLADARLR